MQADNRPNSVRRGFRSALSNPASHNTSVPARVWRCSPRRRNANKRATMCRFRAVSNCLRSRRFDGVKRSAEAFKAARFRSTIRRGVPAQNLPSATGQCPCPTVGAGLVPTVLPIEYRWPRVRHDPPARARDHLVHPPVMRGRSNTSGGQQPFRNRRAQQPLPGPVHCHRIPTTNALHQSVGETRVSPHRGATDPGVSGLAT